MNKIIRAIKRFFYALPFGLKGADAEMSGSGAESDGVVINQQAEDGRVANHLLKGEVTQEVEELRYRTYKVERESYGYDYIGNGVAVKKDTSKREPDVIKFTQENKPICEGVLDGLKALDTYGIEMYKVTFVYKTMPKIKLEKFLTSVDVNVKKSANKTITTLNFSSIANPSEFSSKPFVASLNALYDAFKNKDARYINNSDFNMIETMFFVTTDLSEGEFNSVSYNFCNPKLLDIKMENAEYKLTYEWGRYERVDLTDKFYSKEMDEKYKKKQKKNFATNISSKIEKCFICGKEMNQSNGDIIQRLYGQPICLNCMKTYLLSDENN